MRDLLVEGLALGDQFGSEGLTLTLLSRRVLGTL